MESGMCRTKNAVNIIIKNYLDTCFGSIVFFAFGYGLMFGFNSTGYFGESFFFLESLETIDYNFVFFQFMFAATATTIVSGAIAERTNLTSYIIVSMIITGFIYPIYGSWAWGSSHDSEGWLKAIGFIDFAGSSVVHSLGGWCALAGIIAVGPRVGRFSDLDNKPHAIPGHNMTSVALGAFILWFGWFGFNGGSVIIASGDIGQIALNTHLGGCAGAIGAIIAMRINGTKLMMTMIVNGSLGGLVSITAGCASMSPLFAIITGLIAGILVVKADSYLTRLRLDDVVGAVSVHCVSGVWGTLAAGLFLSGNMFDPNQIIVQLKGIAAAFLWAFPTSFLAFLIIKRHIGLRCSKAHEQRGLDYSEHGEDGYPEFRDTQLHRDAT